IREVTKAEDMTLEGVARKLEIDVDGFVATIRAYNAAVQPTPYNPAIKDGKATRGISPPKSNWAQTLDTPPYVGFAVTTGITFTFGGLRITPTGQVVDWQQRPIVGQEALELAVEHVRDSVVIGVATGPSVGLHQRLRGLERIPSWIPRPAGRGPRVAEIRVRHLRHDLEA